MPRLVRRKPLSERVMAAINPMDFLLWLSEELETRDWDSKLVGTQIGIALNFIFLLARANSGSSSGSDDIFGDDTSSGWVAFLVYTTVTVLGLFSVANAFYTLTKTRKYRLLEANVEKKLSTPSARRVKVQSELNTSSPLRYLADLIAPESAESRAHPDKARDVWELSVWDPLPICLRISCLFSPGHVLVYMIFLPLTSLDARPSVTVFNALVIQAIFSAQLLALSSSHTQQAKDQALIQKEVMHEYDTKFVHPRLNPVVRDVAIQTAFEGPRYAKDVVQTGTPTTLIRNSFFSREKSRAASEDASPAPIRSNVLSPRMFTPPQREATPKVRHSEASFTPREQEPAPSARKSLPAGYVSTATATATQGTPQHQQSTPQRATPTPTPSAQLNFGGNMGIYSHHKSPLKKASSQGDLHTGEPPFSPRNSREMASYEQQGRASFMSDRAKEAQGTSRPNPFGAARRRPQPPQERYPSRGYY